MEQEVATVKLGAGNEVNPFLVERQPNPTITSEEANSILNQIDDILDEGSDPAQLDDVDIVQRAEKLINWVDLIQDLEVNELAEHSGIGPLPNQERSLGEAALGELAKEYVDFLSDVEIYRDFALERREQALAQGVTEAQWDLAVISAREELVLNPVEEISPEELQVLAKNYVERLHAAKALSDEANELWRVGEEEKDDHLWVAVRAIEGFAIDHYNNAFSQGAIEADWETAVNLVDAELSQKHLKDVTSLAIEVLKSHESSVVLVGKKLITFNHEEKTLNVTDRQPGDFLQAILSEAGKWNAPISCFHTAELASFKQQLSEHLSDRALSHDLSERQQEPQPRRQNDSKKLWSYEYV